LNIQTKVIDYNWDSPEAAEVITCFTEMDGFKLLERTKEDKKKIKNAPAKTIEEEFLVSIRTGV